MPALADFALLENVRAADVLSGDVIELPDRVWVWGTGPDSSKPRWRGSLVANDSRLGWSRWHLVLDALDWSDAGTTYAGDAGAEAALQVLNEHFIVLRVGAEAPMDRQEPEDQLVALHAYDLVRIQRRVEEPPAPAEPPWVVLEHQGTAVHWDDASPDLMVYVVDWDEADDSVEYVEAKDYELDRATFLPGAVRLRLRDRLEAIHERHRERLRR